MAEHPKIPNPLLFVGLDRVFPTGLLHGVRLNGPYATMQVRTITEAQYFLAVPWLDGRPLPMTGVLCRASEFFQENTTTWVYRGFFDFQVMLDIDQRDTRNGLLHVPWSLSALDSLSDGAMNETDFVERMAVLGALFQKFLDTERDQLMPDDYRTLIGLGATQYVLERISAPPVDPAELDRLFSCMMYVVSDALWASPYVANEQVAAGLENFIFNACTTFLKKISLMERAEVASDLLHMVVCNRLLKILPPPKYVC